METFEAHVSLLPSVLSCHRLLGEVDYLLHVVSESLAGFDRLYVDGIMSAPWVARTATYVAVNAIKVDTALPVGHQLFGLSDVQATERVGQC